MQWSVVVWWKEKMEWQDVKREAKVKNDKRFDVGFSLWPLSSSSPKTGPKQEQHAENDTGNGADCYCLVSVLGERSDEERRG